MTEHNEKYKHLKSSKENILKMKDIEFSLSGKNAYYLPQDSIPLKGLPYIQTGDIIAITTNIKGLDIAHMGFAIYNDHDELMLLHASSKHKRVLIDPLPLSKLLKENKSWTGIRVLRMKNPESLFTQ